MKRNDLEKLMVGVFSDLRPNAYVDIDTKIKEDLNIDSLELFSACIEEIDSKHCSCSNCSGSI